MRVSDVELAMKMQFEKYYQGLTLENFKAISNNCGLGLWKM